MHSRQNLDIKNLEIVITNEGRTKADIKLSVSGINKYLFLSEQSLTLEPGESAEVELNFAGKDIGAFIGSLIVADQAIPILLIVEEENVLFDVSIDLKNPGIPQGKDIQSRITLKSMGQQKKVDVYLTYIIKDSEDNIVLSEYETLAVEKELVYDKAFDTKNLPKGDYMASVEAEYLGQKAISGALFSVFAQEMPSLPIKANYKPIILLLIAAALILFRKKAVILLLTMGSRRKTKKPRKH